MILLLKEIGEDKFELVHQDGVIISGTEKEIQVFLDKTFPNKDYELLRSDADGIGVMIHGD